MIDQNLCRPDGTIIFTFPFPEHIGEISLFQYINYVVARRNAEKDDLPPMLGVAMAVSEFFQVDVMKVLEGAVGAPMDEHLAQSVGVLFVNLDKIIAGYKPKFRTNQDFKFEWKGRTYHIPHLTFDAVTGQLQRTALSVYDYVETDVTRQRFKMLAEKDGDRSGDAWFSEYTHLIALVARREGEKIPFNPSERETWLQNRATIFQDVPLDIAMDIDFFLTSGLDKSRRHTTMCGSLLLPLLLIAEQAQKRLRLGQTPLKGQKAKQRKLINAPGYGGFTAN